VNEAGLGFEPPSVIGDGGAQRAPSSQQQPAAQMGAKSKYNFRNRYTFGYIFATKMAIVSKTTTTRSASPPEPPIAVILS
jgi:hypothetical protein